MTDHLILRPSGEFAGPVDESTLVLGIETSCDETAAALVMGGYDVVSQRLSAPRSTCTPSSAAWCPRSPAGRTSTCSTR